MQFLAKLGGLAGALVVFGAPAPAAPFTMEDLRSLIESRGLRSVEEVLPQLPTELRSNYTLMFESRSLQPATPKFPRAILFGKDARLTCTFNDHPQANSDSLECFQFRQAERRFDFYQVVFPTPENHLTQTTFAPVNQTTEGVSCTGCHSADPHPNWDSYPFWPGAYGETHDFLNPKSLRDYVGFVERRADHPRYRWLLQGPSAKAPYAGTLFQETNLRFSDLLGRMNSLRAARLLEEKLPPWKALAFAVNALDCPVTEEDKSTLREFGVDFDQDLSLPVLFNSLELQRYGWSTQIFDDVAETPRPAYEQQSGFGFLATGVAMAVIMEQVRAGDGAMASAVQSIYPYYSDAPGAEEKEMFDALTAIQPDPNRFGKFFAANQARLCPRLTQIFLQAASAPAHYL